MQVAPSELPVPGKSWRFGEFESDDESFWNLEACWVAPEPGTLDFGGRAPRASWLTRFLAVWSRRRSRSTPFTERSLLIIRFAMCNKAFIFSGSMRWACEMFVLRLQKRHGKDMVEGSEWVSLKSTVQRAIVFPRSMFKART